MGNLDESFVEEIYEEYVKVKTLERICECQDDSISEGLFPSSEERKKKAEEELNKVKDARNKLMNDPSFRGMTMASREAYLKKLQADKDAADRKAKREATMNNIKGAVKGAFNKAKDVVTGAAKAAGDKATELGKSAVSATATAATNTKNAAIEAGKKAKEAAVNTAHNVANKAAETGEKIKAATEPARDVISYTAHRAKEGGKSILDKVKGAVGKVKNWWNDYKAKAKAYGDLKRGVTTSSTPSPQRGAAAMARDAQKYKKNVTGDSYKLNPSLARTQREVLARLGEALEKLEMMK
jgi:type II secretory pathway component GspD/PulD (secretin)